MRGHREEGETDERKKRNMTKDKSYSVLCFGVCSFFNYHLPLASQIFKAQRAVPPL